jgi:hypothetical protein
MATLPAQVDRSAFQQPLLRNTSFRNDCIPHNARLVRIKPGPLNPSFLDAVRECAIWELIH